MMTRRTLGDAHKSALLDEMRTFRAALIQAQRTAPPSGDMIEWLRQPQQTHWRNETSTLQLAKSTRLILTSAVRGVSVCIHATAQIAGDTGALNEHLPLAQTGVVANLPSAVTSRPRRQTKPPSAEERPKVIRDSRGSPHTGGMAPAVVLFLVACLPFVDVLRDSAVIPAGMDQLEHYSRETTIRRALADGYLPLWNPYEFSGFPLLADIQASVFYPPSVALRVLPMPLFLTWTIIVHVWLFGIGGYAFCRVWGLSRSAAMLAAVSLMLGGIIFPRVYAGHMDVLRTVAWVPLALAAAVRSLDRSSWRPSTALVLVLACQVLGGFLQLVLYTFACVALYGMFSVWWPTNGVRSRERAVMVSVQIGVLVVLVAGCTAFQLVPTARLIMAAGRTGGLPYGDAQDGTFRLAELVRMYVPPGSVANLGSEGWETSALLACSSRASRPSRCSCASRGVPLCFSPSSPGPHSSSHSATPSMAHTG
jgi:hypothetical protein